MIRDFIYLVRFKLFFNQKEFNNHILRKSFLQFRHEQHKALAVLKFYHQRASHFFGHDTYIILLQASLLYKHDQCAQFLLSRDFFYEGQGVDYARGAFLNQAFCQNLYYSDHPAWLFLLSSHDIWQLLGLEQKDLDLPSFHDFSSLILKHEKLKPFFMKASTQENILAHCHPSSRAMIEALLLEVKLHKNEEKKRKTKI